MMEEKEIWDKLDEEITTELNNQSEELSSNDKKVVKSKIRRIVKSKELLFAGVGDSIVKNRIVDMLLALAYQRDTFDFSQEYTLTAEYYSEKCEMDVTEGYRQLKQAAKELARVIKEIKDVQTGNVWLERYFDHIAYNDTTQSIIVKWREDTIPLISGTLRFGTFLTTNDKFCLTSSSKRHAFMEYLQSRIHELAKKDYFDIRVTELREKLHLKDEYPIFADFRKRVIEPSLEDFNNISEVRLRVEYKRIGRSVEILRYKADNL
jgi:plasmid replication initiation protein